MSAVKHQAFPILFLFVVTTRFSLVALLPSFDSLHTDFKQQQQSFSMLEPQNYEVANGINYEYIYVNASDQSKPTFLFIHGFPSSFHSWRHQVEYFSRKGYGCLAPNIMGYGKTYSPSNKDEYRMKSMVEHLGALLDHLHLDKVFVVGHDWGTRLANRLVLYHPERALGLVLISAGYQAPGMVDLDRAIEASEKTYGYATLGYCKFFLSNDSVPIIENNLDSFIDLVFASNPILGKTNFAPVGQLQNWLTNGIRTSRASFMSQDDYKTVRQYLADGMQPKLNWYKATFSNVDWNDEKNIDPTIRRSVMFIGGTEDYVSIISSYIGQKQYISDLEVVELETSHWVMEEKPDAVNRAIEKWIKKFE